MKRYHFRLAEVLGSLAVAALVLVILIVGLVLGLPSRFQTRVPSLQAHDGTTLTGKYLASYDQEVWYGIQYAKPPVGSLRFAGPEPINGTKTWRGGNDASVRGPICPQAGSLSNMDESCLLMNVQRPTLQAPFELLPVVIFIHGGGFQAGSGFDFNPSKFISIGQNISQPFIVVTINYRLGLLGFMTSSDMSELAGVDPTTGLMNPSSNTTSNVRLNRGYLDIQEAIRFVSANIDSYGGDPNRIVLHGQSAGANGIVAQIASSDGSPPNRIDNGTASRQTNLSRPLKPLFRGAILQSPPFVPLSSSNIKDAQFTKVLRVSNCSSATTPSERVTCLRNLSWEQITTISVTESTLSSPSNQTIMSLGVFPWIPCLDGGRRSGGFYADSVSNSLSRLDFANVPIMFGNNLDEGAVFAPKDFHDVITQNKTTPNLKKENSTRTSSRKSAIPTSTSIIGGGRNSSMLNSTSLDNSTSSANDTGVTDFENWIQLSWFFDPFSNATNITYSELAAAYPDIPADGSPYDPVGASKDDRFFPGDDNQFKRAASIYGDLRFQSFRRIVLEFIAEHSNNESSKINVPSWGYMYAQHQSGTPSFLGVPHTSDLQCVSQQVGNSRCVSMAQQFISFIYNLDPNSSTLGLPEWPSYDLSTRSLMTYRSEGLSITPDTFRQAQIDLIDSKAFLDATGR